MILECYTSTDLIQEITTMEDNLTSVNYILGSFLKNQIHNLIEPSNMPMIARPNTITEHNKKYLLTEDARSFSDDIIRFNPENAGRTIIGDIQYKTLNELSNVQFCINKDILEFVLNEWENKNVLFFKECSEHPRTKDLLKANKKLKLEIFTHNENYKFNLHLINIAKLYANTPAFYLPVYMDFRGRVYPYSYYLSYQGSDLARALINFTITGEINDSNVIYLKYYLANLDSKQKFNSLNEKVVWVDKILSKLEDSDIRNHVISKNLSEPFQYYSTIKILLAYYRDGITTTGIPVLLDASCSGLQHFSALCTNIKLATEVNVLRGNNDKINDVYTTATNYVNDLLLSKQMNIKLSRKDMKVPIMTTTYNVTRYGIQQYLEEAFRIELKDGVYTYYYKKDETMFVTGKDFQQLVDFVKNAVFNLFPFMSEMLKYFNDMIKIHNSLGIEVAWTTPSGLKVIQKYVRMKPIRIGKKIKSSLKPITINIASDKINTNKQVLAFMPNMVHSLDSSNIHLLCAHSLNIYTIHDCFASSIDQIQLIEKQVSKIFMDMYFKENYLVILHNQLIQNITNITPIHTANDIDSKGVITNTVDSVFIPIINKADKVTFKQIVIPKLPQYDWDHNKNIFINALGTGKGILH